LIFDNEDRTIPLDEDEVRLTRHVRISTTVKDNYYSYFYVNGRHSSLLEFENLLAHARISADGYNIVQQGDINRITSMSPIDRRRMLDDVAGITKFDKDIHRAEDKRKQVEENLDRIGVLTDEIKRHLKELDKDRSDALKFNELREEVNGFKVQLAYKKKNHFELKIKNFDEQVSSLERNIVETEERIDEIKRKSSETTERLSEIDNKLADLAGDEADGLKIKIENIKLEKLRAKDQQETARDDIEDYKREKAAITKDLKSADKELKHYEKTFKSADEELTKNKERKSELEAELKELEDLASKSDSEISEMKRVITKLSHKIESQREEIHQKNLDKDRLEDRLKRADSDVLELEELLKKYEFELQENSWKLKEFKESEESEESVDDLKKRLSDRRKSEQKLISDSKDLEDAVTNLTREHTKAKLQAETAEEVQRGYNLAVKSVLDARDRRELKGIHGTIAELGNVNEKYNTALITAAGTRMQSIVVDNDESAAKAIAYLKKHKIGRATFLPLNKMVKGKPTASALMAVEDEKAVGFAIDLVDFDKKYGPAFWYVFADTVVANDLNTARKLMGGVRLVTLDGELIEKSGAMIGGVAPTKTIRFGIPTESEIDKIWTKLQKAVEHSEKVIAELQDTRAEIMALEDRIRHTSIEEDSKNLKIRELESEQSEINEKLEAARKDHKAKGEGLEALQAELDKSDENILKLSEALSVLETERDEKQETMLKATSKEIADKINDARENLTTTINLINELTHRKETLQTQIKLYTETCEKFNNSLAEIDTKLKENSERINSGKNLFSKHDDELNKLMKVEQSMSKDQRKLSDERDKLLKREVKLSNDLETLRAKINANKDIIVQTSMQTQDVSKELSDVMAEIQNYNIDIDEFEEQPIPLDDLKKKIPEIENRMERLQPVNLRAIEDYNSQNERLQKLNEEVTELETQRDNLNELVAELMTKKKEGLMEVFTAVNENFKEIFGDISNGGIAELHLDSYKDPFEGGLQIKARPKNKKTLKLEALSGGEKSLTALSLIFAIQRYQPSPFYVLDEVDMFLDGINAENVGKMVTKNTEMAQFIVISLRKVTFKDASHIYGITMQGTGISYIIGKVNLSEIGDEGELLSDMEDFKGPPPKELPEATGG
jgi:chromosome segregation protein